MKTQKLVGPMSPKPEHQRKITFAALHLAASDWKGAPKLGALPADNKLIELMHVRKRSYTNTANFTLRCGVCQIGVIGQKVASTDIAFIMKTAHIILLLLTSTPKLVPRPSMPNLPSPLSTPNPERASLKILQNSSMTLEESLLNLFPLW
ncbi:hypothetical protein KSP39_PZI008760 [Platanthera zijinensis]|uniref:OTU1-like C-terminal C2H2-type zinc finger domain-containing protein n=1 Tax=Platanthera zijinensis TaxID=2320716 RepID=A0AAP0G778_9ASPA